MTLKLTQRVGIGYAAAAAALLFAMLASFWAFGISDRETDKVHDNYLPSIQAANNLLLQLERMEVAEYMYFAPRVNRTPWMQRFDLASGEFQRSMVDSERLFLTERELTLYSLISQDYGTLLHLDAQMRGLLRAGRVDEARVLNATTSNEVAERMRRNAQAFDALNVSAASEARLAEHSARRHAQWLVLAILLFGLIIAGWLWRRTTRDIVQPLEDLQLATSSLARGEVRLASNARAARTIEIASLQRDFNDMAHALHRATSELRSTNSTLEAQVDERTAALKVANERLEGMLKELQELDQLKSDFMAITSHELLTPINFIVGFGSALEDGAMGPLTAEQSQAVGKMLEGAERLTRMVRNTLEYSQLESGRLTLVPEVVDFVALAADIVERYRPLCEAKFQRIELQLPDDAPLAWADPGRIQQVLAELLDNALKFAPIGGRIRVTVQADPACVVTEVADSGPGIPADLLPRLSQPFYQVDTSSTREHGGMGLGLALVKGLVHAMDGTLGIESRFGQGSTFRFSVPRVNESLSDTPTHAETGENAV